VLTEKEGLPNNTVYGILPDDNEHLWISTNRGLSTFHTSVLDKQPQPTHFSNFTAPQGLQSNEFNTGAYHRAADGRLLFGGIGGLNVFDPLKFSGESTPIAVVFTKVVVDNETIPADSSATYKKTITLTYKDHSVGFSFAALDFTAMGQNHFYYQLEGYDKDWIDGEQRNYVSYTNIPAGQYTFRVKYAKDRYSNDVPVSQMQVIIQAPFWEKTWFVTLMIMIALGMIYGLYRYRIAQVLRLVQIRQSIANNLHDDIGSTLSNINILSELSKKSLQKPAQAHTFLDRISEEVQTSSQSLDDIIWSVNTRNDTWPETFSRMRRYASEVFENSSTVYTIELQEQPGMVRLNMEKRRDVFLIYKELLNNIHKHAAATKVEIFMRFRQGQLVMKISDNGNGFDKTAQTHRNGLKSLSSRVDRWKGKFDIKTGAGGTTIEILL
jgi:signal transduction histidine kinase